ncbi:hypothetical protein DMUE_1892 [Dictyocoela muelleri]|nr:hypothetical protein DMUE_1892 [Dictyocoela muelleri]
MITLCLAQEYMTLKSMKRNNKRNSNDKKKSLNGDRKMDYLDLLTSYYSHKNCNNILKNEINTPIIKFCEQPKFECRDKGCQNKNCNNYHLNILNKCDWNNLNEDEGYKFKAYDWNNNNFKSDNCDGVCHDNTDDLNHNNLKCSCTNCCYLNTNYNNQNSDKENFNKENFNKENFNNENLNNENLNNQNIKNGNYCNQYFDNQNIDNQYSDNSCLNNCFELPDIKTIITQPDNSYPSYQPKENYSANQKEICEDVINLPQTKVKSNNTSTKSKMANKDTPYNNFSSHENNDVFTKQQKTHESYIPAVKYKSFFSTIDNNNKINKGEKIKHFNQNCKNYYQNT